MYYTDWDAIPQQHYSVIYSDPPWPYNDKMSGHSFSLDHEYTTMGLPDIHALPVQSIAAKDAVLFMWATSPLLPEALAVMKSWGFKYKTLAFVWSKHTRHGKDVANMGRWTMGNVEVVLLGTRGKPQRMVKNIRQLVRAERTRHSRKPDEVRNRIEQLISGSRIELFARGPEEGWDQFGNEPIWDGDAIIQEMAEVALPDLHGMDNEGTDQ
jgi:N6-adenosine-specific RNA methylase IME4